MTGVQIDIAPLLVMAFTGAVGLVWKLMADKVAGIQSSADKETQKLKEHVERELARIERYTQESFHTGTQTMDSIKQAIGGLQGQIEGFSRTMAESVGKIELQLARAHPTKEELDRAMAERDRHWQQIDARLSDVQKQLHEMTQVPEPRRVVRK